MEVAQGRVSDRPFARTVYAISAQRFTGDLVLREGERRYKTSWEDGRVVAAESAAPADSPGRAAIAAGLVTSTNVAAALEAMARSPGADQLQILSELARLKPDQVVGLKRRLLIQRAARAFALPDAAYVLDNARSMRADPDVPPVDARWLVYFGLRTHYTVDRLERELGTLLDRGLRLADDAWAALPAFSFGEVERAVTDRLSMRAWTPRQLLDACGIEGQVVLSVVYALLACDCLEPGPVAPDAPTTTARGTEDRSSPIVDPSAAEGAGPARPRTGTGTARAVPGAGDRARLAHGTVRRLLFPGQVTGAPPTGEALASTRARRASTRPPLAAEPAGRPGSSTVPGSSPTTPPATGRPTSDPNPTRAGTNRPTPSPTPPAPPVPEPLPDSSQSGRARRITPESTARERRPTPDASRAHRPTPDRTARYSRPHSTTTPPILRRVGSTTIPAEGGSAAAAEIRRMIADRIAALERGADHYAILGVPHAAKPDEIRAAYFAIAKRIHPDRLRAVGVTDADGDAQRLFSRINQAFGVLSDPQRRLEYSSMISAGGEEAVRKAQADAEETAGRVLRAEETFRRGEMALRRSMFEQARALFEEAVNLNGDEAEYHALLAWATWLAAPNKPAVAQDVQKRLAQALALSPQCVPAHFYCGQVAKHSGQTQAAIDSFRAVIQIEPTHTEALLELRVLRGRLKKR